MQPKKPTFVWQGVLIMLPVLVLSIVSLLSFRQDKAAAEQEARNRSQAAANSLARAIAKNASDDLALFRVLEQRWTDWLEADSRPNTRFTGIPLGTPTPELALVLNSWNAKYPTLKLSEFALPRCDVTFEGQVIRPPRSLNPPVPPSWFVELSPTQRDLWQKIRDAESTGDTSRVDLACNEFAQTDPSQNALNAAENVRLNAKWAEQGGARWRYKFTELETESGIKFSDLGCLRELAALGTNPVSSAFLQIVWDRIFTQPSFLSPALLEASEKAAAYSSPEIQSKTWSMRQLWDARATAGQLIQPLLKNSSLTNSAKRLFWLESTSDEADKVLVWKSPATWIDSSSNATQGVSIWLTHSHVFDTVISNAFAANSFFVPPYASAVVSAAGNHATPPESAPLLASAQFDSSETQLPIKVDLYLTSPSILFAAEKRRAILFGLLIFGTVVTAVIGLFTARRAFYRQLQLNNLKSNFVSAVSHELRAPIASVRLMAEGLERGKITDPWKQREYFAFIVQECRRLSSLIGNVLDFSRIEQGRKQYTFEPTDVVGLVEQTVKLITPYAAERQVCLVSQLSPLNPQLTCDSVAIQQALINLIDNAIKHSAQNQTVTVGLEFLERNDDTKTVKSEVHLWVEDNGPGIPPEEHEKIFEQFYRRGSELRRETQGVGIGLTIVKHIVEAHGGRIQLRSSVGQGSRFTMVFSNHE